MRGSLNEIALDIKNQDETITSILLNSEVIKNEAGVAFLVRHTLVNISERRKYEKELLAERQRSEKALEKLNEERLLREQFVATLTHDLRTPISAAKMNAQLLLRKIENTGFVQ